jgi:CHAD domain-containing protein
MVLYYVGQQVLAIVRYDPLVRRDEPDAVHQMRVAARRARSALQAFGQIIERARTRPLCEELKWLAAEFGQARDGEVLLARLTAELSAIPPALVVGPVQARTTGHFTAQLGQAAKTVLRALDGQRYLHLLHDLDALLADPPLTPLAARKAGKTKKLHELLGDHHDSVVTRTVLGGLAD